MTTKTPKRRLTKAERDARVDYTMGFVDALRKASELVICEPCGGTGLIDDGETCLWCEGPHAERIRAIKPEVLNG